MFLMNPDPPSRLSEPVGNYRSMDQIATLKLVRKNIQYFSGNPNNVTIFGQSAGGQSVTWLMSYPAAKGLLIFTFKHAPSYAYYFNYLTSAIRNIHQGTPHTFEIPYVFGSMQFVLKPPPKVQDPIA